MTGRLPAAVLALGLTLACSRTPAPALPSPPPSPPAQAAATSGAPLEALRARVGAILADPAVSAGTWGVAVRSLTTHEPLVEINAHRLLTPASTLKIVTLAITADQLGWDYTFDTRVAMTGRVKDGVLDGDLVVVGSGDPSFDDWDGAGSTVFASWAARLKELGITTIGGRIIGNDDVFTDEGYGSGWMWDDMAEDYSAPASGLQFNQGTAQILVTPGPAGEPAVLALTPSHTRFPMINRTTTVAAGGPTRLSHKALPLTPGAVVSGTIAADAPKQVRNVAIGNPTLYFANALRTGLIANGIDVLGGAVDMDDLVDAPVVDAASATLTHRSPTLPSLADTLMKLSQNLYAETFLRTLGRVKGAGGHAEAGIDVVKGVLASWGAPVNELVLADGSGLSRYNLVSPALIVSVLEHVHADDRLRGPFIASLPVAGKAGTLSNRMKGTIAEGKVQAKTGSFTNARSMAGFVDSADGEPLVFDIMTNNYAAPTAQVDRVSDAIVAALAEFRRQ
ncbi:MAG: D-alanyl-D-alanine carboxypeptidase/D-alanyl-D-alanine-endopeptidase [Vicinamibacterales bacterium]